MQKVNRFRVNLQHFADKVCKYAAEKPEQLQTKGFEDLRGCNCQRCEPLADQKELDALRVFKQQEDLKAAALEEGKKLASEIIQTKSAIDGELKGIVSEVVKGELEAQGITIGGAIGRIVEKKLQFDVTGSNYPSPAGFGGSMVNPQFGRSQLSPQMKNFIHWARTGEVMDKKVLARGTDGAGGYLVPEEFRSEVIRKMAEDTVMRKSGATTFTINGDSIDIPVLDAEGSGQWIGENTAYPESDPVFDNVRLTPHKYARMVRTSYELLEDSAINVADLLSSIFARDFSSAEDFAFIDGSGVDRPFGLNRATLTSVAPTAGENILSSLRRLVYALPKKYRNGAKFFMPGALVEQLALAVDANGRPLWQESTQEGEPARVLGYQIMETDAMPVYDLDGAGAGTATGADIIFGNPQYYYICDKQGMRLMRSDDRYFELGQVAFRSDMRVDGKVALPEAFVKLVGLAT
jgi:HK97 family phage major capsid protein